MVLVDFSLFFLLVDLIAALINLLAHSESYVTVPPDIDLLVCTYTNFSYVCGYVLAYYVSFSVDNC